jgi:hypothetical protein
MKSSQSTKLDYSNNKKILIHFGTYRYDANEGPNKPYRKKTVEFLPWDIIKNRGIVWCYFSAPHP